VAVRKTGFGVSEVALKIIIKTNIIKVS